MCARHKAGHTAHRGDTASWLDTRVVVPLPQAPETATMLARFLLTSEAGVPVTPHTQSTKHGKASVYGTRRGAVRSRRPREQGMRRTVGQTSGAGTGRTRSRTPSARSTSTAPEATSCAAARAPATTGDRCRCPCHPRDAGCTPAPPNGRRTRFDAVGTGCCQLPIVAVAVAYYTANITQFYAGVSWTV